MDLALHFRVLARHPWLVGLGFAAAVLLAFLAFARVGPNGISYRQSEQWSSTARLVATQHAGLFSSTPTSPTTNGVDTTGFAILAAQFANSDAVTDRLKRNGRLGGAVEATVAQVPGTGTFLPIVDVAGIAATPAAARDLARRASLAISDFVRQRQAVSGVKPSRRISLEMVNAPKKATLVSPRSKTLPVMVFFGVISIVLFAAYVRDNVQKSKERSSTVTGAPTPVPAPTPVAVAEPPDEVAKERVESRPRVAEARPRVQVAGRPGGTLGTSAPGARPRQSES